MCLYPKLILNPKYKKSQKNGGIIPPVHDKRVLMVPIGCKKCIECKKQKAREWQVRLLEELREGKQGYFITLTFSNESIQKLTKDIWAEDPEIEGYKLDNKIATIATRRFLERWRKKHKKSVRHWLVTELGHNGTENIHLHGIVWTDKPESISEVWGYGYSFIGTYLNESTVNYVIKYIMKMDMEHTEYDPKILTSAGIGRGYTKRLDAERNKYKGEETREYYTTRQGFKMNLPIYYRNKIYTEHEREQLWINKINQETRYVLGKKIEMKYGAENYYLALKAAQDKNLRMGYGNGLKDWEKTAYEEERRKIMHDRRMGTAELINRHIIPDEVWMF